MSSLNIPFRNPKCHWNIVSSFDNIVDKFRSYTPKTKTNFILFLTLILSLSLSLSYFSFGPSIFCETGIHKITSVITWKTNIEWKKSFIFEINEIKSGRVQESWKRGGTKSVNLMHLWLTLVIDKKMGWGERLNEILLMKRHNLMHFHMKSLLIYIYIYIPLTLLIIKITPCVHIW